jgi:fatty acid desaturase
MQPIITLLTGKASVGEAVPRWLAGPRTKSIQVICQFLISTTAGLVLLTTHPLASAVALPLLWLVQVNALRNFQVVIAHHAVHNELLATKRSNYWLQVLVSALSLTQHFEQYTEDHVRGHHRLKIFTSERDPDAIFLAALGFRPGTPFVTLRRRMRFALLSPRFHAIFLTARIRTNFVTAPWHRKLVSAAYVGSLAALAVVFPWWAIVLALLVPLIPLYHIAAFLQLLSEHAWTMTPRSVATPKTYAERCWARFALEPLPPAGLKGARRVRQWTRWATRLVFVAIPSRFGVVVGDMPGHDLHHLYPVRDWTRTLWERQQRIDNDKDPRGMKNREFTSLSEVLTFVLQHIANTEAPIPSSGEEQPQDQEQPQQDAA